MGLLATLAEHRGTVVGPFTLKDPALSELFGSGRITQAGPVVTELTALTSAAFWDGVQQISADVAKLPLNLHKHLDGGGSEVMRRHPVHRLMKFKPNPETKSIVFRRTVTMHALVYGNGYAEIVRDDLGRPRALWVLHPNRVRPFYRTQSDGRAPLRYRVDGRVILDPHDLVHIQALSDDTVSGFNLVSVAREALGLALASQQFAASFYGNGTRFGGVLSSDQDIDAEQRQEILAEVEKLYAKADKAFRLLILGAGFNFQSAGTTPTDAQMKEIRDQQVTEVARFLNMPLHKLKLNTPGAVSYNSVEMADLAYYKGPILDWTTLWEEELNDKLIPSLERGIQFFRHNNNAFLRGDIRSRYEALGIARDKGIINADEWRDMEDMNPQPDKMGKLYLVQSAQVPVDRLNDLVDAQTRPPEPPPVPPADADDDRQQSARALVYALEQLEAARREAHETHTALEAAVSQVAALEAEGTTRGEEVAHWRGEVARLTSVSETQETIAAFAQHRVTDLEAAREAAERGREAAVADLGDREAAVTAMTAERDAALAIATELEGDRDQIRIDLMATRADVLAKDAEIARLTDALGSTDQTDEETRATLEAALTEARAGITAARDAEAAAVARTEAMEADLSAARALTEETVAAVREQRKAVIGAHRGLVMDAMGRMVRRECEQARGKQATQEKLRRWLKGFPTLHQAICLEAILPSVRLHLAWMGSPEDPASRATMIVQDHVAVFVRQLEDVLDSDPDDFHAVLETVLHRWETDRPGEIADAIMMEEIDDVAGH